MQLTNFTNMALLKAEHVVEVAEFLNLLQEEKGLGVMNVKIDGLECRALCKVNLEEHIMKHKPMEVSPLAILMTEDLFRKITEQNPDLGRM